MLRRPCRGRRRTGKAAERLDHPQETAVRRQRPRCRTRCGQLPTARPIGLWRELAGSGAVAAACRGWGGGVRSFAARPAWRAATSGRFLASGSRAGGSSPRLRNVSLLSRSRSRSCAQRTCYAHASAWRSTQCEGTCFIGCARGSALERGDGDRNLAELLRLDEVVGDQRLERGAAVLLELALDEIRAAAAARGHVGHADTFCRGLRCRRMSVRLRGGSQALVGVFLGGLSVAVVSLSFVPGPPSAAAAANPLCIPRL